MYYSDYPKEPIGGSNPYYRCSSCKISDPEINGQIGNHLRGCLWRKSMEGPDFPDGPGEEGFLGPRPWNNYEVSD